MCEIKKKTSRRISHGYCLTDQEKHNRFTYPYYDIKVLYILFSNTICHIL